MKLKQSLKNKRFVKVIDNKLVELDKYESENIHVLIDSLLDEDNCQLIFRGEKIKHAYNKSGITKYYSHENDEYQLCKHGNSVFYIGSKSDSYLFKTDEVSFPINLNNIESRLFKGIYNEFQNNIHHDKLKDEEEFKKYFSNSSNDFADTIEKLDTEERTLIKYYYLWLLHVIGDTEYKKYSNFLSTSKDYKVASGFSHQEIVYVGWIPRPIKVRSVYLGSLIQSKKRLESIGLPTYSDEPYPNEDEISLIGGLFPHYILGIYHVPKKIFIINDHLIRLEMQQMINSGFSTKIIKHGIGIDQSNFENSEFLKISGYKRFLTYIKDIGYTDHD